MAEKRRLEQVKSLNRERLEELAAWLAERIDMIAREKLGSFAEAVSVLVSVSEEWPYTVEALISVKTRYPRRELERELGKILDQAFAEFIDRASLEGLQPSG
ncbi:MAG: hypothetical protein QXU69_01110 [Thermofilaceae archaeon]